MKNWSFSKNILKHYQNKRPYMSHRCFTSLMQQKLSRMHGFVVIYTWVQILAVPLNNSRTFAKSVIIWASVSSPVKLWSDIPNEIIVRIKWCHVCKASDAESGTQRGHQDGSSPPLPSDNTALWFSNFSLHENHQDSLLKHGWLGSSPSFWQVWKGLIILMSNKFQGDIGASSLETILFRNTNLIKLMAYVFSNFSNYIRNEYAYYKNSWESKTHKGTQSWRSVSYHAGTESH